MPSARGTLWRQYSRLHDPVMKIVARNETCRGFIAIPGVGPVTALWFMTAIDDPLAAAMLDRVLHHCHVIQTGGPSYRVRHVKQRLKAPNRRGNRRCIIPQSATAVREQPACAMRAAPAGCSSALSSTPVPTCGKTPCCLTPSDRQTPLPSQSLFRGGVQTGGDDGRDQDRRRVLGRRSGGKPGGCRAPRPWQGAQASVSASMSGSSAVQTHGAGALTGAI